MICMGDWLLCNKIHPFLWWYQPSYSPPSCGWCAGMLILSINMIIILLTQIIGPDSGPTFASTRSSKNTLRTNPAPSSLPMLPENMPYYRGPRTMPIQSPPDSSNDAHCQAIISILLVDNCHGLCHLPNTPIHFGEFEKAIPSLACPANNDKIPCYAQQVLQFSWAVYSFHGGHFASTIQSRNLLFHVKLACDPYETGRSLFQEFTSCKQIFNSATNLLNHICASGDTSVIHGYLIHSNRYQTSKTTSKFWQL